MSWAMLIIAVAAVLAALYIGTRVIGVLYALAAPPSAPLPSDARELSHTSKGYGEDSWVYQTDHSVCEVAEFYIEQGGQCSPCAETVTCDGGNDFSIFAMRWNADIATGEGGQTHIDILRQVSWSGYFPTQTP